MSTPQGSGSNPPHGNPAEQPNEQASWGQPPPGGWGQQNAGAPEAATEADIDSDRTQRVDPRVWSQQVAAAQGQHPQQPQGQPPQGQQPQGGQQGWAGAQQPQQSPQQSPQQPPQGGWGSQPGQQ